MRFSLSGGAGDRPKQTIHAAELFHDNARTIAYACGEAAVGHVVVAVVTADMEFGGIWEVPRQELARRAPQLEDGGWSLIFSPGCSTGEVEERALTLARLAFERWKAMRRWVSKGA